MAQGSNFGIGLVAPGTNENVIEDNTVVGNTNGVVLVPGTERNIVRRNLVAGNPAVQVAVDHAAGGGVDIRNLSGSDTNRFQANVCLTSLNAPCPALGTYLTASPNPIPLTGSALYGMTTLSWSAPEAQFIDIRIGAPDGKLFTTMGYRGSIQTGTWVSDGMTFYLQDVTGGRALTAENTLATVVVRFEKK